jgi:hypothetical protein
MEGIVAIIVQAIAGAVGGWGAGNLVKSAAMDLLPKIISGVIGGVAGGSILGALVGGGGVDPNAAADAAAATGSLDVGQLIAQLIGGVGGGGILTALVGQFMGKK